MHAAVYLAAHQLHARWRGWAVLVVLVAVAGGAVLAAAAGASRTASAYARFLTTSRASDLLVAPSGPGLDGYYHALARLPGASASAPIAALNLAPLGHPALGPNDLISMAPIDGRYGRLLDVPKVLSGRLPAQNHANEIAIDQRAAALLGLQVGSALTMRATPGDPPPGAASQEPARPRLLHQRVVGIVVMRGSVLPVNELDKIPVIMTSPALFHRLGLQYIYITGAYVKLRPGASPEEFEHRAQSLARQFRDAGNRAFVADENTQAAAIERALQPEAVALALFALVLAVTALLIIGQAAGRLLATSSLTNPLLPALGMTRGQLMAAGLVEAGVPVLAGALAAVGAAVAVSPLMPIGAARLAEPDPGVSADARVLVAGAAAIVVLLVAWVAWSVWRLTAARVRGRDTAAAPGPWPRLTAWLAQAGVPVTAGAGVRLALEPGRGRTAVPVRSALAGTALSVLAVTAAITFGASLLHLVNAPRLYGQRWEAAIETQFGNLTPADARQRVGHAAGLTGWTLGKHGIIGIGGQVVPAIGLTGGRGPLLSPTLLEGRSPRTSSEIVLGTATLRQLGRQVGEWVTFTVNGDPLRARVVGRAVFPNFGQGSFTSTDLGQGAQTTAAVLEPPPGEPDGYDFVLLSFAPGPRRAANVAGFQRSMHDYCRTLQQTTCVLTSQRPNGITNYASIDRTPAILAGLLAVIGAAVLGQFIVLSGRRRRRDFAVMKALGMFRRQVSAIIAWQVSTLTGLALLLGLPLGIAAGRWSWLLFCRGLGIPAVPVTPIGPLLIMVPAVIVVANAVALWPGRANARLRPAEVLRAE
jgi:putative ABC transport system permease protein